MGDTVKKLGIAVIKRREELGHDTSKVWREIEEYFCSRLPSWCSRPTDPNIKIKDSFSKQDFHGFLKAVEGTIRENPIPEEEANRRANICAACPYNSQHSFCGTCSGLGSLIFKIIEGRKLKQEGKMHSCQVCGCSLKAKVWVPDQVLRQTDAVKATGGDYPPWCWVNGAFNQTSEPSVP